MIIVTNLLQSLDPEESRRQLISRMMNLICLEESNPAFEIRKKSFKSDCCQEPSWALEHSARKLHLPKKGLR